MARFGSRASTKREEVPGIDEEITGNDDSAIREPRPEPGTELAGRYRDEGGMIVPEVRPVYATPPPAPTTPVEAICTGCRCPIPVGETLLDAQRRPWCSNECHADWSGADV